tara:strand:+ start:213 stop:719 length:507 start_codon:yes stop_codon:yes gene_type:complete
MTVKELKKNNMAFKMKASPIKDMSELRAKQRRMSRGESEFQYRNRMRREASAEAKKSIVPGSFSTKRKLEGDLVVNQDLISKKISKPKKSNKIDWTKAPKVGTKARTKWYMKNNLALDDTTPSVKSTRNEGVVNIQLDPEKPNFGAVSRVPFQKKSPSKKRGYKMKRK